MKDPVTSMHPGWNLGNTLDATGGETSWGNPTTTKGMIDAIAATGFKSIRIPVTWFLRSGNAPDYLIDPTSMARVQEIAGWALENHLYVILNLHHDSRWLCRMADDPGETAARFSSYWRQIADAFKEYPPELLFESINEPCFSDKWDEDDPRYFNWLDQLNTVFYNIVRASGGRNAARLLLMPTLAGSPCQPRMDALLKTIQKLNDPCLIATVHYYGYYPFSVNMAGVTAFNDTVQDDMEAMLNRCADTFLANGIPVIVGEYGLLAFDRSIHGVEHGEMLKYIDAFTHTARQREIPLFLWDNGQHFDRNALIWRDPSFIDTILFNCKGRTSTAERDYIFLKKQTLITDASIPLHAHSELTGVQLRLANNGNTVTRTLTMPLDYRYGQDNVLFTANFLLSLPSQPLGITAWINLQFAEGPDWVIRVVQYDTPVLKPTTGLGSRLQIPTAFNGDELAAMEAHTLKAGKIADAAGPDSWTAFKQFNHSFNPDYANGHVLLTDDFWNSLSDGEYRLRFHFLSGTRLEYTISKVNKNLSGTPCAGIAANDRNTPPLPDGQTDDLDGQDKPAADGGVKRLTQAWRNPAVKAVTGGAGALVLLAVVAKFFTRKRK